jgi:hypothetical protein
MAAAAGAAAVPARRSAFLEANSKVTANGFTLNVARLDALMLELHKRASLQKTPEGKAKAVAETLSVVEDEMSGAGGVMFKYRQNVAAAAVVDLTDDDPNSELEEFAAHVIPVVHPDFKIPARVNKMQPWRFPPDWVVVSCAENPGSCCCFVAGMHPHPEQVNQDHYRVQNILATRSELLKSKNYHEFMYVAGKRVPQADIKTLSVLNG